MILWMNDSGNINLNRKFIENGNWNILHFTFNIIIQYHWGYRKTTWYTLIICILMSKLQWNEIYFVVKIFLVFSEHKSEHDIETTFRLYFWHKVLIIFFSQCGDESLWNICDCMNVFNIIMKHKISKYKFCPSITYNVTPFFIQCRYELFFGFSFSWYDE